MREKGLTLIEVLIPVFILGILVALAIPIFGGNFGKREPTRCSGGYLFDKQTGEQIKNEQGGGVPCQVGNGSISQ